MPVLGAQSGSAQDIEARAERRVGGNARVVTSEGVPPNLPLPNVAADDMELVEEPQPAGVDGPDVR